MSFLAAHRLRVRACMHRGCLRGNMVHQKLEDFGILILILCNLVINFRQNAVLFPFVFFLLFSSFFFLFSCLFLFFLSSFPILLPSLPSLLSLFFFPYPFSASRFSPFPIFSVCVCVCGGGVGGWGWGRRGVCGGEGAVCPLPSHWLRPCRFLWEGTQSYLNTTDEYHSL